MGPLGNQRLVEVEDRLPRVLELLASEGGVVVPTPVRPLPIGRVGEVLGRLRAPAPVVFDEGPAWPAWLRGPSVSSTEQRVLGFDLRPPLVFHDDTFAAEVGFGAGPEIYSRGSVVGVGPAWDYGWNRRQPIAALDAQATLHLVPEGLLDAWGRVTFDLTQDHNLFEQPQPREVRNNIPPLAGTDVTLPHRAVVALGGPAWNLHLGRDRLDVGNGQMGNLAISDAVDFYDFGSLQLFVPWFTWTTTMMRLDPTLLGDELALPGMDRLRAQEKHVVLHRFEVVLLEKVHVGLMEGVTIGGVAPDLRFLNPLLVLHDLYPWNEVSAYVAAAYVFEVEATVVPVRGLRLWGQAALNQYQSDFERERYGDVAAGIPNAMAGLAGLELCAPLPLDLGLAVPVWLAAGMTLHVFAGVEVVETNPWFGVRENPLVSSFSRRRLTSNLPGGEEYVDQPLGWRFGPDSRVWRAWLGVLDVGAGDIEIGMEHREQGQHDLRTAYEEGAAAVALTTPTGVSEEQWVFTLRSELLPLRFDRFTLSVHLDYQHFWIANLNHLSGATLDDHQLALGLSLRL